MQLRHVFVDRSQVVDRSQRDVARIPCNQFSILLVESLVLVLVAAQRSKMGVMESQLRVGHQHAAGLAGTRITTTKEGERTGAGATAAVTPDESRDTGLVEEFAKLKALGQTPAGRVEHDRD